MPVPIIHPQRFSSPVVTDYETAIYIAHAVRYLAIHVLDTNNGTCTCQKTRQIVRKHWYEAEERKTKKLLHKKEAKRKKAGERKKRRNEKYVGKS